MTPIIPDTLEGALILSVIDFFLSFVVISFIGVVLAGFPLLNRIGALFTKRRARPAAKDEVTPAAQPAEATTDIPSDHIAAIAAAVAAVMDASRIVRIEPAHPDSRWLSEGRHAQHFSHAPKQPSGR
jgi:hypothetical protein